MKEYQILQYFFQKSLYRNAGQSSRDYLKGRGLTKTAADYFGIGFAPNNFSALKDDLIQKGAKLNTLIEAGLLVQPEDTSRQPWDRFRDRIMFPIHDSRGRLVAFGGRAMDSSSKAKYLNSPETPIFQKGHLLYNYHRAHIAVSSPQSNHRGLIVAEGYMDVIALSRAGFKHAVAPMGTALTESQLMLLWRSGPEPILCFDGDKAGIRAYRSIERALPLISPTRTLRFAMLPDGEDPDDLIKTRGKIEMQNILSQSIPLVKMLWEREINLESLNSPEAKAGLKSRIFDAIKEIQNDLFDLGVYLTTPISKTKEKYLALRIKKSQVEKIEQKIDKYNSSLKPLNSFILPGGSEVSSLLHMSRTIARRAERDTSLLGSEEPINAQSLIYLNRLSDLLFVLCRVLNENGLKLSLIHISSPRDRQKSRMPSSA